jgi:hypothetical protein
VSPDGCTLALTVALLLSGIDVVMFAPLEAFECVVAAAKQSLQQRVLKRTISASAMDESLARLQHSSHADAGHYTGPLLFIPNQAEYHQPQVSFSAFPAASCFILGPVARVTPEAGLAPALCCLNWSGGISTMAEVVVGLVTLRIIVDCIKNELNNCNTLSLFIFFILGDLSPRVSPPLDSRAGSRTDLWFFLSWH